MKQIRKILSVTVLVLMVLTGLFFTTNIYVIGNTEAAIQMHDDLPRNSSHLLAQTKVLVVFITGILYLIAVFAIIKKRYKLAMAGVVGCLIFIGEYIIQLICWYSEHPRMLIDFSIFGTISLLIGINSFLCLRKSYL